MTEYGMYKSNKAGVINMASDRLNQVCQHLEGVTDPSRIDGHVIIVTGGAQGTIIVDQHTCFKLLTIHLTRYW